MGDKAFWETETKLLSDHPNPSFSNIFHPLNTLLIKILYFKKGCFTLQKISDHSSSSPGGRHMHCARTQELHSPAGIRGRLAVPAIFLNKSNPNTTTCEAAHERRHQGLATITSKAYFAFLDGVLGVW